MSKNLVKLDVKVVSELKEQASYGLDKIYEFIGSCVRDSGKEDKFKIQFSNGIKAEGVEEGSFVHIEGEIRTVKVFSEDGGRKFTRVYLQATSIKPIDEPEKYENSIEIEGYSLVKDAFSRKSYANDDVDITELVIKIPRGRNKMSYVPCTAWNNLARLSASLKKDDVVDIKGRLQSHVIANGSILVEVSVTYIEKGDSDVNGSN